MNTPQRTHSDSSRKQGVALLAARWRAPIDAGSSASVDTTSLDDRQTMQPQPSRLDRKMSAGADPGGTAA